MEKAKAISEVDSILDSIDEKSRLKETDYPPIKFEISPQEISVLRQLLIIDENQITKNNELLANNALAKILYALSWKQGDLKKIKHIIKGITSLNEKSDDEDALTFHQFGRFLADRENEPIVDQHTIRAFACYIEPTKIESWRKLSLLKGEEHKKLISKYKEWLQKLTPELMKEPNSIHHVDKVLFALGKSIKKKKS